MTTTTKKAPKAPKQATPKAAAPAAPPVVVGHIVTEAVTTTGVTVFLVHGPDGAAVFASLWKGKATKVAARKDAEAAQSQAA